MELASQLPLLFISPESHALISEGPQKRRRFLDWGVFHVEHRFLSVWRRYQRALKQRNKSLGKTGIETAWDRELVAAAEQITEFRQDYLSRLEPFIDSFVQQLVDLGKVTLSFARGWRQDIEYRELLRASQQQDREYGFTRQGPHRADLIFKIGDRSARDILSRGQQKLFVIALLLAQVALLNETTYISPIILIDDLAAELDTKHRHRLLSVLSGLKAQVILTVTERQALSDYKDTPIQWFHVEQGKIMPILEPEA